MTYIYIYIFIYIYGALEGDDLSSKKYFVRFGMDVLINGNVPQVDDIKHQNLTKEIFIANLLDAY